MALNKAQYRLLEEGINTRFENGQIDLSHVAALVKKNKIGEVILPDSASPLYQDPITSVYSYTPADMYWLINPRVEVITNPLNCETAPALATQTLQYFVYSLVFPEANASAPFYPNIQIQGTVSGVIYTAPSPITAGFSSRNSNYVIINNIIETLNRRIGTQCYWERFNDNYSKNTFYIVSNVSLGTLQLTGTGLITSTASLSTISNTVYNRSLIPALASKKIQIAPVKVQAENTLYQALKQNQFYKSRTSEVLADQTHDYFILYREESFIITRMYYDYIRKPRTISLSLNQSCELADTTHHKIVDLAVEILRLDTKDPVYQATVQDTQNRTQ